MEIMFELVDKRSGEKIISVVRRHWIFLLGGAKIIAILVLAIIIFCVLYSMGNINSAILFYGILVFIIFIVIVSAYYLFLWKNDLFILTNYRIIDIDQHELFRRSVHEAELENIQEVSFRTHGFLHTVFKIGDVTVKTAGPKDDIILEDVSNPHLIQREITETCHQCKTIINNNLKKDEQQNQTTSGETARRSNWPQNLG